MQNILPWQNCSWECKFKSKIYFDAFWKLYHDTKQWQSILEFMTKLLHINMRKILQFCIFRVDNTLKYIFVCDIKDSLLITLCDNIWWSRIQKLKPKTRRLNFANVSNERTTRVPLEAMSLKLRDLKRSGQVIWLLWGIPIGFHILKVLLSNWIKAWNVW